MNERSQITITELASVMIHLRDNMGWDPDSTLEIADEEGNSFTFLVDIVDGDAAFMLRRIEL